MRLGDFPGVLAATTAAVVVAAGGAFSPAERLAVSVFMALVAVALPMTVIERPRSGEIVMLAAVAWAGISAAAAVGYPLAAKEMVGGWLVAWLVWSAVSRVDRARGPLLGTLVAIAAVVPALAIVAECVGAGRLRMGGLYLNPNVAAAMLVPAIPAAWCLLASSRRRLALGAAMIVVAAGVVLSGSRAGFMALVVVIGLMLPRGKVRMIGVAAASAAAVGFVLWRFVQSPDSLAWHRLEIWRALWPLVRDHPLLGVGPGWLEDATGVARIAHEGSIARWGRIIGSAESTPYGLLVRTGFMGLGLAMIGGAMWWRRDRPENSSPCGGSRAVLAGIGVLALFHDYLMVDVVLWWWAVLVGAVYPTGKPTAEGSIRRMGGVGWRIVAGLAGGFLVLWTLAQPAYARRLWWSSPSTTELVERAVRAEPWFAEPVRWWIGDVLERENWSWETAAEALAWSRRAASTHPGSSRVWMEGAQVHSRVVADLGPWPDAIEGAREGYRRSTSLEPHVPWAWLRWAQFERSLGHADEARRLAERAVAEEPNFVRGRLFLARLNLDSGDRAGAGQSFERARSAFQLGRRRSLTDYERDLLRAPDWQVEEIARELAIPEGSTDSTTADLVE